MKAKHTTEPWERFAGNLLYVRAGECLVADCATGVEGMAVAGTGGLRAPHRDVMVANARRIVACINILEGIPTETLEQILRDAMTPAARLAALSLEAMKRPSK